MGGRAGGLAASGQVGRAAGRGVAQAEERAVGGGGGKGGAKGGEGRAVSTRSGDTGRLRVWCMMVDRRHLLRAEHNYAKD